MAKKKEILDPRQAKFLELYANPGETFGNAYQSAIKAGYSEEYAKNLKTRQNWLSENVKEVTKDELVKKSKRVLNKALDGEDLRLAQDTAKFIAKTDTEFSEKKDLTTDGKALNPILVRFIGDNDRNIDTN